jgi:poly-gamma-glutamate synthesis protein (capsule biosynthesis protein)
MASGDAVINRRVSVLDDSDFVGLRNLLQAADAALTNFETTTPRPPLVPAPWHGFVISSPPFVIDELHSMGFNLFSLANNHALGYGWQGFVDTLAEFQSRGLAFAGGGRSLAEARAPVYLDLPRARLALVGATITNASAVLAADPGRGTAGRAGANPLRSRVEFLLDEQRFNQLVDIDEALGTASVRRAAEAFGPLTSAGPQAAAQALRFLGGTFLRGAAPGVRGGLHLGDMAALERSVHEAHRQADLVVVSIHCHEGHGGEWNSDVAPDFLVEAAHRCIDAGADLVAGHGPHRLRGFELYRGKPVFYSLGNFFLQLETVDPVPPEAFEAQGMPADGVPADFHDRSWQAEDGTPIGFAADPTWFESVIVDCEFEDGGLASLRLHPIELGSAMPRPRRGVPRLVGAAHGSSILDRVAAMSHRYGTDLEIDTSSGRAVGNVQLSTTS